jgi:hypothetical protein
MVELATVDLVLSILLKSVLIAILVFVILLLRNLDNAVRKLESSAESIGRSADTVEDIISVARKIPFVGPKRRRDIDVE